MAGISIVFVSSRNPPLPDSRGVIVENDVMNGGQAAGCDPPGISCANNA